MAEPIADFGVCVLAGGESTRLPGKLERPVDGTPLILHVYRGLRDARYPIFVSSNRSFSAEVDGALDCPVVIDRWPKSGPLGAMISAFGEMPVRRILVAAGDAPFVTREIVERLRYAWCDGDEAVVARSGTVIEPLCAIYDRAAFLREAWPRFTQGTRSVKGVVDALETRFVDFRDGSAFAGVNTEADYRAACARGTS
ncbi:MAG: molybdenum cofactor guanylyltransferase [Candidatus Eremiobacteraeota bacterium]|nr:molybdenum cofactor guanylyltransferase [Candidatus Eremiobacteraeota bacterium]